MDEGLTLDWDGLTGVEERLAKLVEALIDLRPFWPMVVPLYNRWMKEQFDTEGDFFGDHWQELSPGYAAWKSVHYPTKGLLMAEGDLRKAATTPTRDAQPHMLTLTIEPYEKTTRVDAFNVKSRQRSRKRRGTGATIDPAWFQTGTDRTPARPLLPITGELPALAQGEIGDAAEAYLHDTARRLGLL